MKVFYGDIFIEREELGAEGIWHPVKLEYYKTVNKDDGIYGIDVVKTEYIKNKVIKEEKELEQLSYDETKIEEILKLLKKYVVTPITVQDVVEDLLKENFY